MHSHQGMPVPWAAIPLFQSLKPAERESLRPLVRLRSYEEGETIFREGDPAASFHFVLGGKVKIVKSAPDGRDVILEIFGPGDPVGVLATYEERNFPAAAVALEATTLLSIPRQEFFALLPRFFPSPGRSSSPSWRRTPCWHGGSSWGSPAA